MALLRSFLISALLITSAITETPDPSLAVRPTVGLDYIVHKASLNVYRTSHFEILMNKPTRLKATGTYYNFTNIRYAKPSIGNLRFALPVSPRHSDRTVDDGGAAPIMCSQALPGKVSRLNCGGRLISSAWQPTAFEYLSGVNVSQLSSPTSNR